MTPVSTQDEIQHQIEVIKKANADARETKESAIKFLEDAGILKPPTVSKEVKASKKK